MAVLDPAFHAPECSGFDPHAHAFADGGRQPHLQICLQRHQNLSQLAREEFLICYHEEICDAVAFVNGPALFITKAEEYVPWKQWLPKYYRLPPIAVSGFVTRQRGIHTFTLAVPDKFLFAPGLGVGHRPEQFTHEARRMEGQNPQSRVLMFCS